MIHYKAVSYPYDPSVKWEATRDDTTSPCGFGETKREALLYLLNIECPKDCIKYYSGAGK